MLSPATDADLTDAAALINVSYRGEAAEAGWTHENGYISGERITAAELAEMRAGRPDGRLLLHRSGAGALVACVWLEPHCDGAWYLGLLAVRPDRQDRKLGGAVLEEAETLARRQGGHRMRLTVVHIRETLIAWYQRRGYRLTDETEPFPQPALALRDLHLVVLEKAL